ncbi:MAG: S41 family peptidase, partial [Planctomycetaceae bacterium]
MRLDLSMSRVFLSAVLFLGATGVLGELAPPFAPAAARAEDVRAEDVREAIDSGVQLERQKRWLDAIEHYEAALETWSENSELQYGLRRSKIQYDVDRRYADESFQTRLLSKSQAEALEIFDDVLAQVRENYVDSLSSTSFVAHGTESLYLALRNDSFARRHLRGVEDDQILQMRRVLRESYWNKPVANQAAARELVVEIAGLAQRIVGLDGTAVVMEYVFGGCNAMDDYSRYLTPDRLKDLYGNIDGEFVGLGIEMKAETGQGMLLVNVLPGSPASEGGLLAGDYIVNINGTDCRRLSTDAAASLLRGREGSQVRLRIFRSADRRELEGSFTRREVHVKSIPVATIIDRRGGIGYI